MFPPWTELQFLVFFFWLLCTSLPVPPPNPEVNSSGLQDTSSKKGLKNCSFFTMSLSDTRAQNINAVALLKAKRGYYWGQRNLLGD